MHRNCRVDTLEFGGAQLLNMMNKEDIFDWLVLFRRFTENDR